MYSLVYMAHLELIIKVNILQDTCLISFRMIL
jgi:hypothetical protein